MRLLTSLRCLPNFLSSLIVGFAT